MRYLPMVSFVILGGNICYISPIYRAVSCSKPLAARDFVLVLKVYSSCFNPASTIFIDWTIKHNIYECEALFFNS